MIIYVPRLIESAEQAEALPEGTVLVQGIYSLVVGNDWHRARHESTIGWTALVPIEAKEEITHEMRTSRGVENFAPSHGIFPVPSRRLVTPWEALTAVR